LKAVPANLQNPLGLVGGVLAQGTVAAAVAAQGDAMNPSDLAGFPNGRRPKDDVVDIALIAVMGGLCSQPVIDAGVVLDEVNCKPSNVFLANGDFVDGDGVPTVLKLTDKADQEKAIFLSGFPYLNTPNGGTSAK
jgi:hypothetical protein